MSKQITITGKNTIHKFKKKTPKREIVKKWNLDSEVYTHSYQVDILNEFMDTCGNFIYNNKQQNNSDILKIVYKEIKTKIHGYKQQDIEKNMYNPEGFITIEKVFELVCDCKLECTYCKQPQYILYENVRQMNQWSIDRIDNTQGHNSDNVVISCLKCNLQKRRFDHDKFMFTKQMKLVKLE
jgi:hypothetical protein